MRKAITTAVLAFSLIASVSSFGQNPNEPGKARPEAQAPQEIIKIGSTLVNVPVIVTDRFGRFVPNLAKTDFTVREDGKPQKIDAFSAAEEPFNVALLLDTSRSTVRKLDTIRKAAETFTKQLQPRDSVMIVTFDDQIKYLSGFTGNVEELKRAIKTAKTGYSTRLYDAIHLTIKEKLLPLKGRKAIVVLTDGVDTASKFANYESTIELVASSGIITYAIQYETRNEGANPLRPLFLPPPGGNGFVPRPSGFVSRLQGQSQTQTPPPQEEKKEPQPFIFIPRPTTTVTGSDPSTNPSLPNNRTPAAANPMMRDRYLIAADFLKTLATLSGARYLRAETVESTSYQFALIAEDIRNLYTLAYYTTNDQQDGGYRRIMVNVKGDDYAIRARHGYRAPKRDEAEPKQ